MIDFFVPGIPRPGGSKRAFRTPSGRIAVVDDCRRSKEWRACVALAAQGHGMLPGPLRVMCTFFLPRPKSHLRAAGGVRKSAPPMPVTKPDATKLWRATEDALTGILWRDDAQIVEQHITKRYADNCICGARIRVENITEAIE